MATTSITDVRVSDDVFASSKDSHHLASDRKTNLSHILDYV